MKDCKSVLLGGVPPADVFSAVARTCCKQRVVLRSLKPCVAIAFASVSFPCCFSSVLFKLWWMTNNRLKETTRELFDAILFFLYCFVSSYPSFVTPIIFLDMNHI